MAQSFFRQHSTLELLKPVATKFASFFITMQRLQQCKDSLQETVVDREHKTWLNNSTYQEMGQKVTDAILSAEKWQSMAQLLACCEHIVTLLRLADGNQPCTGKFYWKMLQLCEAMERCDLSTGCKKQIHQLTMTPWKMLHRDLHSAGFILDPEYIDFLQHENDEVVSGFHVMIEKVHLNDLDAQAKAILQHSVYRAKQGLFARPMAMVAAKNIPAHCRWLAFGSHIPELQKVAVRIFSQVCSASACERNWSMFDFIHTKKRNRLLSKKVRDVVFIHSNLRLKEKLEGIDYQADTIEWGDRPESEDE